MVRLREVFASEDVPVADGVAEMRRMEGILWVAGCGGVATARGRANENEKSVAVVIEIKS